MLLSKSPLSRSFIPLLAFTSIGFSAVAEGQIESHESAYSTEEVVVVTGTRTEKLLSESPVKVEVVTREEIALKNARNLKEALKDVPGILLKEIHGKFGYEAWMQGVDAERVLVLVDSEPVSKSTNNVTDLTQIGVMNIERVEIVKGATSALYGSGAIGGVINVITRKPDAPFSYTLKVDAGSHGEQNVDGEQTSVSERSSAGALFAQSEHWDLHATYDYVDADGYSRDPSPGRWQREGPEGYRVNAFTELGFSPDLDSRYFVSTSYYKEDLAGRQERPINQLITKKEITERDTYKVGGDWLLEDAGELKLRYFFEDYEDHTEQDIATNPGSEQWREAGHTTHKVSSSWSYAVNDDVVRTIGFEYLDTEIDQVQWRLGEGVDSELQPGAGRSEKVFYAQDDWMVSDRLELLPGFRFQHDSDFGYYVAPKMNGKYKLDAIGDHEHFLRFGIGRGYKVPSLKERYFEFDHSQNGYKVLGNSELTPEYSDSFQFGWVIGEEDSYNLDINLFRNHLHDFIATEFSHRETDPTWGLLQIYRYTNLTKARTQGVEVATLFHLSDGMRINSGYTYLDARNRETSDHLYLAKRPKHQVKTSFTYSPIDDPFSFNVSARWQSSEYFELENINKSPDYVVVDFSAAYEFTDLLSVYWGVDNIGNTQKARDNDFDLRPKEGRYVYVGLRLEDF